ncbi:hypothetical protein GQ457_10G010710 [Hibiscus cannabinus]
MKSVFKSRTTKRAGTIRQTGIPETGSHGESVSPTAPAKGAHLRDRRELHQNLPQAQRGVKGEVGRRRKRKPERTV